MTLTLKSLAYLLIFGDRAASNPLTHTLLFDIFRYSVLHLKLSEKKTKKPIFLCTYNFLVQAATEKPEG